MDNKSFEGIFGNDIEFENEQERDRIVNAGIVHKTLDGIPCRLATHKEIIKNIQDIYGDE